MNQFYQDFEYFIQLIKSNKNFAYARYADGEVALMQGRYVDVNSQAYRVDNWHAPNHITKVGEHLLKTLNHTEDTYYYAISSKTDNLSDYEFLSSRIKTNKITFANLWINANYQKTKQFYESYDKSVYVICNVAAVKKLFPFNIKELFPFPNECVTYWEEWGNDYINQLIDYVRHLSNETFFISCGPVSEILIHELYTINPNNQYIDVGSSIDEYVHGRQTRPYMNPNSSFSKEISSF